MFEIEFYEKNGRADVFEFLEDLRLRREKSKDARIQYEQAATYIQLLADNGTIGLPKRIAEHLEDGIWELRPGNNRIFSFSLMRMDHTYCCINSERSLKKTPPRELKQAKAEREDYLERKKG